MSHEEHTGAGTGKVTPLAPLIQQHAEECAHCWGCVRHCPARALKVIDGKSYVIEERCVKCGVCVTECGNSAHHVRSDVDKVAALLTGSRPVVALLATEYVAALHPLTPFDAEKAILAMGFIAVETTVLGEEIVAAAYEQAHVRADSLLPQLRSTCPVVVDWIRRFHPHLTGALVPVLPPYVAQAKLVRSLYPDDIAIVYVAPCWARKDEALSAEFDGAVDVAIGFDELSQMLAHPVVPSDPGSAARRASAVKQLSATDGFPRRTLSEHTLADREVVSVRGLVEVDRMLGAISRGEVAPTVVDLLNCEGCIDGPCVNPTLSVFAKRAIDMAERERQPPPVVDSRAFLSALPPVPLRRSFSPEPVTALEPTLDEIDAVLAAGEFETRSAAIDCGACGYKTCVEHAAAIWQDHSTWEMCFPLQVKRLQRECDRHAQAAMVDELTGLLNRRAFEQRFAEEVARAGRYGTPLSLVMFDLDSFKLINDRHGHTCGDEYLRAVGVLLTSSIRECDVPVRISGDEFALILPNTGKTDAWAVAEKLRANIARLVVCHDASAGVSTTASIGVASLCEACVDYKTLLEAADGALYRAKRAGRDRVDLAAG